jgi:hypothetical protein
MEIDDIAHRSGPVIGIRILDISEMTAGPLAATLLADFGALPRSRKHLAVSVGPVMSLVSTIMTSSAMNSE